MMDNFETVVRHREQQGMFFLTVVIKICDEHSHQVGHTMFVARALEISQIQVHAATPFFAHILLTERVLEYIQELRS